MRKNKSRLRLPLIFVIIILVAFAVNSYVSDRALSKLEVSYVTRVIDGDTIVIEGGERVRLLNMDTRERGENCYTEAKQRLEGLILLKNITLERDKENKDRYDRLLRYVYLSNTLINLQLVKEGLAIVYIIEPNTKYQQQFKDAEKTARQEGGCVWTKQP